MDRRSRRDLLSDLPLSIIHSILTFVPIRDAVKTSILSKQWRYIWATLPYLVFDDECASEETSLNDFVNQALLLHKGPIHEFKLSSIKNCYIDQWLLFLSKNGIRNLILNAEQEDDDDNDDDDDLFEIHSSIYACESLIQLELVNCKVPPPPPTFNGFLCLRSLALKNVELPCKAIESIVAGSPLLEELTLYKSSESLELRIHVPNLKSLGVKGYCIDIFSYAPLLRKLTAFYYKKNFECLQQKSSACNYTNFLSGFTNIEELNRGFFFLKYLSIDIEPCHSSLVFHHLRVIDLFPLIFGNAKQMWVVVRLITGAPNLHRLNISSGFCPKHASEVASISFWDSEFAPNFKFQRLKVIEMYSVLGEVNEMELVKFLLASAPVLETLTFIPAFYLTEQNKSLNLTREVLSYRRASTNAHILFK